MVEKCVKVSNRKQRNLLIYVLSSTQHLIPSMIKHCYGNYVIKALLAECNRKNQILLIKSIKFYCPNIKDKNHSNHNKYCKDLIKVIDRIEEEHKKTN